MKKISRKPTSWTSPPWRLQVSPWANSWQVVTNRSASQARRTVSQRRELRKERAAPCRLAQSSAAADTTQPAEKSRKAGVQKKPVFGASQVNSRSGSKKFL